MVAKSYQKFSHGEPYIKNNKMYCLITKADNSTKEVRWYSDEEYAKIYKEEVPQSNITNFYFKALGFDRGISIPVGNIEENVKWLRDTKAARYCTYFGWYFLNSDIPSDIPMEVVPLNAEEVFVGNQLRPQNELNMIIGSKGGEIGIY